MAKAVVLVVGVVAAFVLVIVLIGGGSDDADSGGDGVADVAALYRTRCAACHGADGGGGNGPPLSGGRVVERYPDVADQIELVTSGRLSAGMPGFGEVLSDAEIEAVVAYTRSL